MKRARKIGWLIALSLALLGVAGVSLSQVKEVRPSDYVAINCTHISNWDWLRTQNAETTWTFATEPFDRMPYGAFLMIDALVTQRGSGGAGYSTSIVLEAWSASLKKYSILVNLDNPLPFEDPRDSSGVGYMTHATVMLPVALKSELRKTGELTVRYKWSPSPLGRHVAVHGDCMKIVY